MSSHSRLRMATTPEEQRRWMEQWRFAGVALEEQRTRELRGLTEVQAGKKAVALLEFLDLCQPPGTRRHLDWETSGLVEQQRLFQRARQRGPRTR